MNWDDKDVALIAHLYVGKFGREYDDVNWRDWGSEQDLSHDESDSVYDRLERVGLVKAAALGPYAEITDLGVLYVEDNGLADAEFIKEQRLIRHRMLVELHRILRELGSKYCGVFDELVADLDLDREKAGVNLLFLERIGYVESLSVQMYRITRLGEAAVDEFLANADLASRYDALEASEDHQGRGHKLEDLITELALSEGFSVASRARSQGEENDLVLAMEGEHWLLSCKWESGPAKSAYVDEVRIRVAKRPGTVGVLISLGGFSGEAVAEASSNTSLGLVLLFSKLDLEELFSRRETLLQALREKRKVLVAYRQAVFRQPEP